MSALLNAPLHTPHPTPQHRAPTPHTQRAQHRLEQQEEARRGFARAFSRQDIQLLTPEAQRRRRGGTWSVEARIEGGEWRTNSGGGGGFGIGEIFGIQGLLLSAEEIYAGFVNHV